MRMSGRMRWRRRRQNSSAGSPCVRIVSRTVRRMSGRVPRRAGAVRRVQRRGGVRRIRAMMRRSAASSSGVQAANDLSRRTSVSEAIRPRLTSSSSPDSPGLGRRDLEHRLGRGGGPDRRLQRLGVGRRVALVQEEPPEHAVVHGDLVATGDHGRAPGPVEVGEVARVQGGDRGAARHDVAGARGEAGLAQLLAEGDEQLDDGRLLRHRRRSPRGARAPGRGRRAP